MGSGHTQALEKTTSSLTHRGPDDRNFWSDPAVGIALGHQRLSIIDLSVEGRQPMVSASGRYVLAYNGEVYSFTEMRLELEKIRGGLPRPQRHRGTAGRDRAVGIGPHPGAKRGYVCLCPVGP
ncbi:MAG: hypothetical protein U5P10_05755 [Spirochaetia bacterium]|nr:hypothetical protein [Spirochaetia bacterium]